MKGVRTQMTLVCLTDSPTLIFHSGEFVERAQAPRLQAVMRRILVKLGCQQLRLPHPDPVHVVATIGN